MKNHIGMINMQAVSKKYRSMMKSDCRKLTTAVIYIGAINQDAQMGSSPDGYFNELSTASAPANPDEEVTKRYFSWEENLNRLDGKMYFPPEFESDELYNQGIITEELSAFASSPTVIFNFTTPGMNIRGLTIDFGISYPKSFTVETNEVTRSYEINSGKFVTEDIFDNSDYLKITPGEMSHGKTRFRIEKILFGIGITLGGKKLLKVALKEKTHPISLKLPTVDLSFSVDNQDRYFNASAPDSEFNYLKKGQQVTLFFYQTLADGTIEKVKGAHVALDDTWKDKVTTAEFSATDRFYQMDGIYEEGLWRPHGITAYEQLKDVFLKAGLKESEFYIDEYLHTIKLHNPVPKDTYANCVLLIANACRCVIKQNRFYQIMVMASFIPDLYTSSEDEVEPDLAKHLIEAREVFEYFDWQKDFNALDGSMYFPPENGNDELCTGYVSTEIADDKGNFIKNPTVTMTAEVAFTFFQLTIYFGSIFPEKMIIHCFKNNEEKENFAVEVNSEKCVIVHTFRDVDKVKIEITKAGEFQRVYIRQISVGETSDFYIDRSDMLKEPSIEKQDELKDIQVIRTIYSKSEELTDVYTDTITLSSDLKEFKIPFTEPVIPVTISTFSHKDNAQDEVTLEVGALDYGGVVVRYSNWYAVIKFITPPEVSEEIDIVIKGYKLLEFNPEYLLNVNSTGYTPAALKNPLIDSEKMAKDYADWCADYYKARAEYKLSKVTGDPALESNDLAYCENEDASKQLIRVHTVNIKFDGAYSGSSYEGRSIK